MPVPSWVEDADERLTQAFLQERLGPRSAESELAVQHLRWALWCLESLYELRELIELDPTDGDGGLTRMGHRSYPVGMGHLLWASVTAMGAVDRMAAAFGALTLGLKANGKVWSFAEVKRESGKIGNEDVLGWLQTVASDPTYEELLAVIRNSMVHSTTLIQVTTSITLGRNPVGRSGGSFAFKGSNGRAMTATSLLDEATPFVERLVLASLALAESGRAARAEPETSA